jgi:hypothetical protein
MMDVRFQGDIHRVQLLPEDRYVLTCDEVLSQEQVAAIGRAWAEFVGEGRTVPRLLVLDDGKRLNVYADTPKADDAD